MQTRLLGGAVLLILLGAGAVSWSYWQDPTFWRRWWIIVTHLSPDHMDFRPTAKLGGGPTLELPAAQADGLTVSPDALREAERFAAEFDSYALIVVHWGVVQTEWYAPGWNRDRLTQSQSMMKTLAALALGAAMADGYIKSVDEPVATYLPEWAGDPRGAIRIRDLLQMASGLAQARFTLNPFAGDSAFRFLNSSDRAAIYLRTPSVLPPAREFDYNDLDAALVGLIVQRATGQPWARWFDQKIWRPMGGQRAEVWLDRAGEGSTAMTACCMLAPAMDWARVGLLMKDRGLVRGVSVLPAEWIDAMTTPSPLYPGYGYFTWLGAGMGDKRLRDDDRERPQTEPFLAPDLFMLLGRGGQRVYVSRALDLVIVRLGPHNGMEPLKAGWDNSRLPNIVVRGLKGTGNFRQ
jgi:CubicO group peptidase (beta-lactamase class C family)